MKSKISFFVINHTSVGGVERVTARLISLFHNNNLNVYSIISFADQDKKNKTIKFDTELKIKSVRKKNLVIDLSNYLKKEKITHLIFQGDNMSISQNILKAVKKTNCKAYLHYHGSPYAYLKKNFYLSDIKTRPVILLKIIAGTIIYPIKKYKLKKIIRSSKDGFITVSDGVKRELNNLYNTRFNNVVSIHNPTSFCIENPIDIKQKEKTIIIASRLVRKHKNVFLALKVWEKIHKKYPNWKLKILGYGVLDKKMRDFIKTAQLTNVKIYGYVNNVDYFIKKSSISLVTSDTEGFSMFTYESLGFKNPIVSTDSYGGIHDMITHNYNGLISPRNNINKMVENLELLMSDDILRCKMGNNSYTKYLELKNEDILSKWRKLLKIK